MCNTINIVGVIDMPKAKLSVKRLECDRCGIWVDVSFGDTREEVRIKVNRVESKSQMWCEDCINEAFVEN